MNTQEILAAGLGRSLFRLTWPMLFGVLALMSYQLADAFWIARLGVEPLAALGFTVPVQQLVIGMQVGLGIATTAIISRTLGAGDPATARAQGGAVIVVGALGTGALVLTLWSLRPWILTVLGADPALLPLISEFWVVWLVAAWLGALVYFGYSVHRAQGDTRFPGLMMLVSSLLNMVLDPLFIFTFGWGLQGAAWATVVAFGVGCLITLPRLSRRQWVSFHFTKVGFNDTLRRLGGIGGPAMLSQLMPPVSAGLATMIVAGFGSAAVAAWGLGARLEFFSIVVVLALTMSLPPLIGRFLGAGDLISVQRLVKIAVKFVLFWQLGVALVWLVVSGTLVSWVAEAGEVQDILTLYLLRVPFSFPALGVCMLMVSVCNALGMPLRGLMLSVLRLFACFLPAVWLGAQWGGIPGLLNGVVVGNLLAGLVAWQMYRQGMNRLQMQQASDGGHNDQA